MTRHPRLTVRARLTFLYTGLFAVCGAIVVAVSYSLVARVGTLTVAGAPGKATKVCQQAKQLRDPLLNDKCNAALRHLGAQSQRDLTLHHLLEYSLITLAVVIALATFLGWIVAGRTLRPVHRITAAARAASEHNLSARVALHGPRDELQELAETFDAMLDRLQTAFEGQKRFIANASHELRTPLAVMRATVDVVLANPASTPDDLRGMAADIRAAVDHAEHLVGALLILARNERGLAVHDEVDLATITEDALDAADLDGLTLHATLEPAVVSGDPVLAEHLVGNLLDNAARYNVDGGDIWVDTRTEAGSARLTVANTGATVGASDAERVFEPFRRIEDRTSHDGFGLGLAIVASIAAVHGGGAAARPRPGGGLTVTVTLPARTADGRSSAALSGTLEG